MNTIEVKRTEVGGLETNCYLIYQNFEGENRGIVVDPGDDAARIIRKINELELAVDFIFVTHAHFDHIMAVGDVAKATGAPVFMHFENELFISNSELNLAVMVGQNIALSKADIRYINDGDRLSAGGIEFVALHTPGHTYGCCCLYTEQVSRQSGLPIMITGDTLFEGSIGRVDFPTGSMKKTNESLRRLKELAEEKGDFQIFPGHGASSTLKREISFNHYFKAIL